jgi:hypothetical protein
LPIRMLRENRPQQRVLVGLGYSPVGKFRLPLLRDISYIRGIAFARHDITASPPCDITQIVIFYKVTHTAINPR